MKKILLALTLLPTLSFASVYNCSGSGFVIDIAGEPIEMKIVGNGFNSMAQNVRATSTFDTTITGNTASPAATIKLIIKDSSFGNPGDSFKANLQVSSPVGIKEFSGLSCIRGND
ncbi:MAG: hypothetical protein Q7U04_11600 [Bacteriovorax sp.]|nr:hypothetical protein [Bacteriovorax sp.]